MSDSQPSQLSHSLSTGLTTTTTIPPQTLPAAGAAPRRKVTHARRPVPFSRDGAERGLAGGIESLDIITTEKGRYLRDHDPGWVGPPAAVGAAQSCPEAENRPNCRHRRVAVGGKVLVVDCSTIDAILPWWCTGRAELCSIERRLFVARGAAIPVWGSYCRKLGHFLPRLCCSGWESPILACWLLCCQFSRSDRSQRLGT